VPSEVTIVASPFVKVLVVLISFASMEALYVPLRFAASSVTVISDASWPISFSLSFTAGISLSDTQLEASKLPVTVSLLSAVTVAVALPESARMLFRTPT